MLTDEEEKEVREALYELETKLSNAYHDLDNLRVKFHQQLVPELCQLITAEGSGNPEADAWWRDKIAEIVHS